MQHKHQRLFLVVDRAVYLVQTRREAPDADQFVAVGFAQAGGGAGQLLLELARRFARPLEGVDRRADVRALDRVEKLLDLRQVRQVGPWDGRPLRLGGDCQRGRDSGQDKSDRDESQDAGRFACSHGFSSFRSRHRDLPTACRVGSARAAPTSRHRDEASWAQSTIARITEFSSVLWRSSRNRAMSDAAINGNAPLRGDSSYSPLSARL